MLTVSLVGKKFSCNIQLKISAEKDGGGLELALKAGEKCSNRPQAISNVTASLNITIQRGCNNYVTKCKEMLMFLQEQALPKTMNIIKVHMVNRETKALQKDAESRLFSCIRPSKRDRDRTRERSASRDRSSTRGYSSDSEQLYRHSHAASTDSLTSRQSNKTDIIATPRMSRHRLKNAALLRDRKQRETSKERHELSEKENREKETRAKGTSLEIHLPVRENKNSKEKRYSVRSFDPEVDSQGDFIYDGGSESSLRAQVIEDSEKEGETNQTNSTGNTEKVRESDRKISVTDSDMSVDSLECLDLSSKEIQEKKKKKKRKIRKRVEGNSSSKEDVTSRPSSVSQLPQLALPEDFQDSSIENSDVTTEEHEKTFSTNSTKILSDLAQQIVSDIVRSAVKKCGTPTPHEVENVDNNMDEGHKTMVASVQSKGNINDDVMEGTPLEPAGIKLEFIEDNSEADDSKAGELLATDENNGGQKCGDDTGVTDGKQTIVSNVSKNEKDEGKRLKSEKDSVITEDKTHQDIARITETKRDKCNGSPPADAGDSDIAGPSADVKGDEKVPQDSSSGQGSSSLMKATNEAGNVRDNKSSLEVKEPLDPQKRCSTEQRVMDDTKCDETKTKQPTMESERMRSNGQSHLNKVPECTGNKVPECTGNNAQDSSVNDMSILLPDPGPIDHSTPPIRLYDTHDNITNRIIKSVSQVLHLQTQYATPTQSSCLLFDPDVPLAYYTTPGRGFEGLLNREFTSNNQRVLEGSQPASKKDTTNKTEKKSGRHLADRKSEETFQRFVQGQRFCSRDGRGSATSRTSGFQDSESGASTSYIHTSSGSDPHKGYCYFVVGSDSTSDEPQKFDQDSSHRRVSTDEGQKHLDTAPVLVPRGRRHGERPKSGVYHRSISEQNERKRWITAIQEPDLLRTAHQRSSSADTRARASRNNKCMSCPVLSEEDIVLEGLESHHKDVCNSLSQRTWVILRVHELWKAKKPLEALKMCMELTGIKAEGTTAISTTETTGTKDNALFLNILQQLPSSCSAWSLSMCDLLLPELKLFISTRRHTSHVDMACNVLQVIVKKVSGVILKVQKENKDKPDLLKNCVANLRDVSDRISQVLVARRGKIHTALTTEDPIALKPVLRDLLSTIQTLLRIYVD